MAPFPGANNAFLMFNDEPIESVGVARELLPLLLLIRIEAPTVFGADDAGSRGFRNPPPIPLNRRGKVAGDGEEHAITVGIDCPGPVPAGIDRPFVGLLPRLDLLNLDQALDVVLLRHRWRELVEQLPRTLRGVHRLDGPLHERTGGLDHRVDSSASGDRQRQRHEDVKLDLLHLSCSFFCCEGVGSQMDPT